MLVQNYFSVLLCWFLALFFLFVFAGHADSRTTVSACKPDAGVQETPNAIYYLGSTTVNKFLLGIVLPTDNYGDSYEPVDETICIHLALAPHAQHQEQIITVNLNTNNEEAYFVEASGKLGEIQPNKIWFVLTRLKNAEGREFFLKQPIPVELQAITND